MKVTDQHVAALRALLTRADEFERLVAPLEQAEDLGFPLLLAAAFHEAVGKKFSSTWRVSDVIRYVAAVRARAVDEDYQIDPLAAERLIRWALGDRSARVDELDDAAKSSQVILLVDLISEAELDDAGLDEFLTRARERAELSAGAIGLDGGA